MRIYQVPYWYGFPKGAFPPNGKKPDKCCKCCCECCCKCKEKEHCQKPECTHPSNGIEIHKCCCKCCCKSKEKEHCQSQIINDELERRIDRLERLIDRMERRMDN